MPWATSQSACCVLRVGRADLGELVDRHLAGDVLLAQRLEGRTTPLVAPVGAQPLGLWAGGELGSGGGVVEGHHAPAWAGQGEGVAQPRCCGGLHRDAGTGCGAGASRQRAASSAAGDEHLDEGVAGEVHPHVGPAIGGALDEVDREVVEQLVGQHRGRAVGPDFGRGGQIGSALDGRQGPVVQGPLGGGSLHEDVPQRSGAGGPGGEDRTGPRAGAGTHLDDRQPLRLAERPPPRVEGAGHDDAEERADLGAGEEVAAAPGPAARGVEAGVGLVEGEVHDLGERQRPPLGDGRPHRRLDPADGVIIHRRRPGATLGRSGRSPGRRRVRRPWAPRDHRGRSDGSGSGSAPRGRR